MRFSKHGYSTKRQAEKDTKRGKNLYRRKDGSPRKSSMLDSHVKYLQNRFRREDKTLNIDRRRLSGVVPVADFSGNNEGECIFSNCESEDVCPHLCSSRSSVVRSEDFVCVDWRGDECEGCYFCS